MKIDANLFKKINYEIYRRFSKNEFVTSNIQGGLLKNKQWCIKAGGNYYLLGNYEIETASILEKSLTKGDVFYDLGANTGYFSMYAAQIVGEKGKVYAFEPLPRNVEYLRKHIQLNQFKNIELVELAVSDKEGTIEFSTENNQSANTYVKKSKNFQEDSVGIKVSTNSLDNLSLNSNFRTPDVIKIDVEGAELDVLKGAEKMIKKIKPRIILSTHDRYVPGIKEECLNFLKSYDYNITSLEIENQQNYILGLDDFFAV